jgi:hypothetical protein
MTPNDVHPRLFLLNATVLLAHQVDAAYWQEWELFGIPGGIQVFVLLNLPIIAVVLHGVRAIALDRPSGVRLSWLLVASGLFAAVFHAAHLLRGDDAFRAERPSRCSRAPPSCRRRRPSLCAGRASPPD